MKNYGLIESEIVLEGKEAHHVLGDCNQPMNLIQSDGQWLEYLPKKEPQERNGVETYACTVFGCLNQIETLGKKLFGPVLFNTDFSDRAAAIMSHIGPNGANPHSTYEYIRKGGLIAEALLPFADSITTREQYYFPNPLPENLLAIARGWLQYWEFGHDWVFVDSDNKETRQNKMMGALTMSPLAVSGSAWFQHIDGKYYSDSEKNHWFEIVGYVYGKHWIAYDTYPDETGEEIKLLDWNFDFGQAKRITLRRKTSALVALMKIGGWIAKIIFGVK